MPEADADTILLVDDEPAALDAIRRTMRQLRPGWRVLTAQNAQEAVASLAGNLVSVVVTDLNMVGHDGIDLLDFIQSYYPTCGRIALTGMLDGPSYLTPGTRLAHHYLLKPCPSERLFAAIEACIAKRSGGADQRPRP